MNNPYHGLFEVKDGKLVLTQRNLENTAYSKSWHDLEFMEMPPEDSALFELFEEALTEFIEEGIFNEETRKEIIKLLAKELFHSSLQGHQMLMAMFEIYARLKDLISNTLSEETASELLDAHRAEVEEIVDEFNSDPGRLGSN